MALLWWRQTKTKDATSVDLAWSIAIGALTLWYATQHDGARVVLVATIGAVWSGRLSWHLYRDRVRGHDEEDGRYKAIREHFNERVQPFFFLFYQGQAFVAVLFSVPMWLAMQRTGPLDILDFVGIGIAVVAIAGESIADAQLAKWRRDPDNKGKTCRAGLWRYSRHPNYFFEWTYWFSYLSIAAHPLALIGPVGMLLFLFKLTGIPYTEKQAIKSRGDDYRRYQETTSVFIPWFPKEDSE